MLKDYGKQKIKSRVISQGFHNIAQFYNQYEEEEEMILNRLLFSA
jgi:poly-D-alanine transfer protein DltD